MPQTLFFRKHGILDHHNLNSQVIQSSSRLLPVTQLCFVHTHILPNTCFARLVRSTCHDHQRSTYFAIKQQLKDHHPEFVEFMRDNNSGLSYSRVYECTNTQPPFLIIFHGVLPTQCGDFSTITKWENGSTICDYENGLASNVIQARYKALALHDVKPGEVGVLSWHFAKPR